MTLNPGGGGGVGGGGRGKSSLLIVGHMSDMAVASPFSGVGPIFQGMAVM